MPLPWSPLMTFRAVNSPNPVAGDHDADDTSPWRGDVIDPPLSCRWRTIQAKPHDGGIPALAKEDSMAFELRRVELPGVGETVDQPEVPPTGFTQRADAL